MIAGGIAITKLKAMEEALSVMPTVLTWPTKNLATSKMGIPRKPGKETALLFNISEPTKGMEVTLFFIVVKMGMMVLLRCFPG